MKYEVGDKLLCKDGTIVLVVYPSNKIDTHYYLENCNNRKVVLKRQYVENPYIYKFIPKEKLRPHKILYKYGEGI